MILIKNRPAEEECLHLEREVYEFLRNRIINGLLQVFDKVEFTDAGWKHYELLCHCIKFHGKEKRQCMNVFNIEEWHQYSEEEFNQEMQKKLEWCIQVVKVLDLSTLSIFPGLK